MTKTGVSKFKFNECESMEFKTVEERLYKSVSTKKVIQLFDSSSISCQGDDSLQIIEKDFP